MHCTDYMQHTNYMQHVHIYTPLLFQGLHPRIVTEGFELAKEKALKVILVVNFKACLWMVVSVLLCHRKTLYLSFTRFLKS